MALHRHFGPDQLAQLQDATLSLYRSHRRRLNGRKPVAPDLWLVDKGGNHRFIEVKLPADSLAPHQLAGMAAIACYLRPKNALSVEVIELHPNHAETFAEYCRLLKRVGKRGSAKFLSSTVIIPGLRTGD